MPHRFLLVLPIFLLIGCSTPLRVDQTLTQKWKFLREDAPNAASTNFNDKSWQTVTVPHTFNATDGADGGSYYRGPSWYRTTLSIPGKFSAKRLFLRFEAASIVADVYLNGAHLGSHRGAFGAFCFDITDHVRTGHDNLLAVRVDNSKFPDIPPLSGDFTIFGGIYRPVHLIALDPLSISPLDDASPGMYITQRHVSRGGALIDISSQLQNYENTPRNATLQYTVSDADHKIVASESTTVEIQPHTTIAVPGTRVNILKPRVWHGRSDPYLYTVTCEVLRNNQVTDRITQPLGLRTYTVDPRQGFSLNGSHYPLHGVNRHQDFGGKGWAISHADQDQDMQLLNELGATVIRLAHYQHSDYFYSLCDKNGVVAWAELALVNQINSTAAFSDSAKQQLRELIKQNYNHPSICFWSLFNEISRNDAADPHKRALISELNTIAHSLDPNRLTTAASNLPTTQPLNAISDVIGFNRYPGWYSGSHTDWPTLLDDHHRLLPTRSIGISEYGAGASIHQHEANPTTRPKSNGAWHPEEWQSILHEHAWAAMSERPWLWGTFVWVAFDFASDARHEGDAAGINDKGLVTRDRKTKKDAFYFYKANWSNDPFVYITSRRFTPRPTGLTTFKVYSNCESVEFFLNDQSLGSKQSSNHIFLWPDVRLTEGETRLRAVATRNNKQLTDEIAIQANPSAATRLGPTTTTAR